MRLIDADALKIDFYDEYETEDDEYAYGYVSKHQIDSAPTIDAVSVVRCKEWIPCSERLPEKDGRYLTTYPLIRDMKWVHILWYGEPSMPSRDVQGKVWYVSDEEYGDVPYDDVIAWMPLPQPYGERKESE